METLVDNYDLPKLNQEEIEKVNRSVTCNEIEVVIKSLPTKEKPSLDGLLAKFLKTIFKEALKRAGVVAQWQSTRLACMRHWVQFLAPHINK